ncbi:MAG: hypothetical protein AAGM22_08260 [Acidobacteriota bacterium]
MTISPDPSPPSTTDRWRRLQESSLDLLKLSPGQARAEVQLHRRNNDAPSPTSSPPGSRPTAVAR